MSLSTEEKVEKLAKMGEEITEKNELINLLNADKQKIAYFGCEPSGRCHLGTGLIHALNTKILNNCGCKVKIWIADWFAQLNNKLDGDLEKLRITGEYMIEVWKACGIDPNRNEFLLASEEINKNSELYWSLVMDICKNFNINQLRRCTKVLGRKERKQIIEESIQKITLKKNKLHLKDGYSEYGESEELINDIFDEYERALEAAQDDSMPTAYLLYAAMQCADIYFLGADICQLGMDQRKVNMLAREYHSHLFKDYPKKGLVPYRPKPVIISHHMLMGLKEGQEKMSKSDPESAIFMEDSEQDVNRKIKRSFCKPGDIKTNPVLDWIKHLIFPHLHLEGNPFIVNRKEKFGGDIIYNNFEQLEADYRDEKVHPADLKPTVSKEINRLLEPVRQHFKNDPYAKKLFEQVKKFRITK